MNSGFLLYSFVTLLAMLNPVEAAAAFATLTFGRTPAAERTIALRATLVGGFILLAFGFAGAALFSALGITLAAFRIAGGLLLLKVAFNMVFSQQTDAATASDSQKAPHPLSDPSVFPLAIPIITGPGALTAIVTLFGKTHGDALNYAFVVGSALVALLLTYLAMRAAEPITRILGSTGIDAISRVVGIVIAAIAIQLVIDGGFEALGRQPPS
jgi:multiple antibiotic resistance protein